ATIIVGNRDGGTNAVRGVYLVSGAVLSGVTVTNGSTRNYGNAISDQSGGGVFCEPLGCVVTNSVITGCSEANLGGGIYSGNLYDCTLVNNSAGYGGGAESGVLSNCVVRGNNAYQGGGTRSSTLTRCLVQTNSASYGGGAQLCSVFLTTFTGNHSSTG